MDTGKLNAGDNPAIDWHPILQRVEIFLVVSCYRNRVKFWPDGPLGSYADLTYLNQMQTSVQTKKIQTTVCNKLSPWRACSSQHLTLVYVPLGCLEYQYCYLPSSPSHLHWMLVHHRLLSGTTEQNNNIHNFSNLMMYLFCAKLIHSFEVYNLKDTMLVYLS